MEFCIFEHLTLWLFWRKKRASFIPFHTHSLSNVPIIFRTENGASEDTVASKGGVTETNEQARTNFQQMISAAVTNAQQQNTEYAATRRRIGSGRIVDSSRENLYPIGMDARYMRNKLFKDDGKTAKNWKSGNDFDWKQLEPPHHDTDNDNTDAKSDEPEWANCGPIS